MQEYRVVPDPDLPFDRAVILGATGPTGIHLAEALRKRGVSLRLVSRSKANLDKTFGTSPDERFAANALESDEAARAIEGYPVVFDCIGLPGDMMDRHPLIARNIATAVNAHGARCVQVSSYWAYLPAVQNPMNEDHPRAGGNEWIRHRRSAEDILLDVGAAVLHFPDYYGPRVHSSSLQQPLREAAQGKTMNWIGSPETEREYIYVPDAMEIAARVACFTEAYGQRWCAPGSGPLTGNQTAAFASHVLGREVKVRGAGLMMLRVVGIFNKQLRGFLKMVPEYLRPAAYDASKLERLIGPMPLTPYEEGIRETLNWLKR